MTDSENITSYGLSENNRHYYIAEYNKPSLETDKKLKPIELSHLLSKNSRIIMAIPHHIIWRRIYHFPKSAQIDLHQHIIQLLNQELPIPLTQIQFDYKTQIIDNHLRLSLFAIRKSAIKQFSYTKNMILDCELHCIARAIHHLNDIPMDKIDEYSYPFEDRYFHFNQDGLIISKTQPENTNLMSITPPLFTENEEQLLHLKAIGAALWNGSVLI